MQFGETPLHCAARNGHLETVQFLVLEAKADAAAKTSWVSDIDGCWHGIPLAVGGHAHHWFVQHGSTPLHFAANNGHLEIVRFLVLEADADLTAKNKVPSPQPIQSRHIHAGI